MKTTIVGPLFSYLKKVLSPTKACVRQNLSFGSLFLMLLGQLVTITGGRQSDQLLYPVYWSRLGIGRDASLLVSSGERKAVCLDNPCSTQEKLCCGQKDTIGSIVTKNSWCMVLQEGRWVVLNPAAPKVLYALEEIGLPTQRAGPLFYYNHMRGDLPSRGKGKGEQSGLLMKSWTGF